MSWRSIGIGSVLFASWALLVVACAPTPPAPAAEEKPAALEKPKLGGVARFGTIGKPGDAHPFLSANDTAYLTTFWGNSHDTLIDFDYTVEEYRADFPLVGMIAESWKWENPTSLALKIRQGVKWHDGKDLTVEDVIWSLEYTRDPKEKFGTAARLAGVDKIEKVDAATLRLTTKEANPQLLPQLAGGATSFPLYILPKQVYDAGGTELMKTKVIGTGPFKVAKFDPAGSTVFVRNESYWRKDKEGNPYPYVGGMEFIHNMDRTSMQAALAAQEIDLFHFVSKTELDGFKASYPDFDVKIHHTGHGTALVFNSCKKPFNDLKVRKAVFLAVDWQTLNDTVMDGLGKWSGPVVPGLKKGWGFSEEELNKMPGYRKDKTEDLAEAKRLLAEAGYPEGLKVDLVYHRGWGSAPLAEFVPIMLKKVGITVEGLGQDGATATRNQNTGNFDMTWNHVANESPLVRLGPQYESTGTLAKAACSFNPEMDKLIAAYRAAGTLDEQRKIVRALAENQLNNYYSRNVGDPAFLRGTQKWLKGYLSYFTASPVPGAGSYQFWLDSDLMPAKRKAITPGRT